MVTLSKLGANMKPIKMSIDDLIAVYFMEPDVIRAPGRIGMSIAPGKNDEDIEQYSPVQASCM
jgi:hypothetical protein